MFNWIKLNDGELKYIRRPGSKDQGRDEEMWMNLYNQHIEINGLSDLFMRLMKVKKEKALLEVDFVLTRDRFKLTEISIQETKLEGMMANAGEGLTIEQSLIHLSRWLGYKINSKEMSAKEYFEILREYGKENTKN